MKIPTRIVVPVLLALICAGSLMVFLWWQLTQSTFLLQTESGQTTTELGNPSIVIHDSPIDPRDRSLLHLRQGDLLALRGQWADAQYEYELSVEAGGGLPALRKLAQAQLQRRDISAVRSTIKKLKTHGARAEDLVLLASIIELRSGELLKAHKLLENAEESPQKHYGLALLSIVQGNHQQSQLELQEVVNGWEPVLRSNARILQSAYNEFSLFSESSNLHLITLISRALAQVQECELALPLLVQVTGRKGDYRDAWIVQGYCELTTERPEQALASLEHAYSLDPQKPEIQYFLAKTHAMLGEHRNAITFFEYALTNGFEPQSEVRRHIAEAAIDDGNIPVALEQYDAMTKAQDVTFAAYKGYVTTVLALDQPDRAFEKAAEGAERWPEDARTHELLAEAAIALEKFSVARTALERALQINPYSISAKEMMGKLQ